ncbi:helix-turn-helix domain-containing protein [Pelosinus baikalensis]|uniref:Uncharacterized protein n=1 Tax=Pelosinus baikalensis TaxID=2892015 RepID=A0ABS8I011_9FIRM|nr:hypothetical protein [Pelosinus baikalensis]
MPYKEIAAKYAVSVETVKSWRKRHGWSRDKTTKKGVQESEEAVRLFFYAQNEVIN